MTTSRTSLTLALGFLSCAKNPGPVPPSAQPPAADTCQPAPRPLPAGPHARAIAEYASLSNPAKLALSLEQVPTGARYGWGKPGSSEFPFVQYARVSAVAYRFWDPVPASISALFPGCLTGVVSDDGRLCPSVVVPPKELAAESVRALLEALQKPAATHRMRCDFDPHHAFIFTDREARPVADVQVCFSCGEWSLSGAEPVPMPSGVFEVMASLCRKLELGGCPLQGEEPKGLMEAFWEWSGQGAPARASAALGIPEEKLLRDLTAEERRRLCAYRAAEIAQRPGSGGPDRVYDFGEGRMARVQSFTECLAEFPSCDVPLAAVEGAAFHVDRKHELAEPAECLESWVFGPLGSCIWGIARDERPPRPAVSEATRLTLPPLETHLCTLVGEDGAGVDAVFLPSDIPPDQQRHRLQADDLQQLVVALSRDGIFAQLAGPTHSVSGRVPSLTVAPLRPLALGRGFHLNPLLPIELGVVAGAPAVLEPFEGEMLEPPLPESFPISCDDVSLALPPRSPTATADFWRAQPGKPVPLAEGPSGPFTTVWTPGEGAERTLILGAEQRGRRLRVSILFEGGTFDGWADPAALTLEARQRTLDSEEHVDLLHPDVGFTAGTRARDFECARELPIWSNDTTTPVIVGSIPAGARVHASGHNAQGWDLALPGVEGVVLRDQDLEGCL